jgi:group II intron reverse transcriptase/maturase
MPDTVGLEQHKPTSLRGIAEKAKADKQHRFRDLYRELNAGFLLTCWPDLNKDAASGVDKVTAGEYAENLHDNIQNLAGRLKDKSYRTKLVRRHWIPKENGKQRPLGIPALEDKLVQLACAKILTAIYEQDFLDSSYGYRPERSARHAVQDLTYDLQFRRYGYIVESDVKGFYDNMGHDWLLEMLSLRIDDRAFFNLIRKWLKAGILETDGTITNPDTGTPQGGIVSPVLANVYLHFALDLWFEKVVKPRCRGKAVIYRYADDWVCAFQLEEDAQRFYQALPKRLEKFQLETAPEKTQIVRFSRFQPGMERRFTFLGFEFFWDNDRKGVPRVKRRTSRKKLQGACKRIKAWIKLSRHLLGGEFFKRLNARLVGHYNYYGVRGNSLSLEYFFKVAVETVYKWLNRRGGKRRSFNWAGFAHLLNRVRIARPRITEVSRIRYA